MNHQPAHDDSVLCEESVSDAEDDDMYNEAVVRPSVTHEDGSVSPYKLA